MKKIYIAPIVEEHLLTTSHIICESISVGEDYSGDLGDADAKDGDMEFGW